MEAEEFRFNNFLQLNAFKILKYEEKHCITVYIVKDIGYRNNVPRQCRLRSESQKKKQRVLST
jgi:hypothetical protein